MDKVAARIRDLMPSGLIDSHRFVSNLGKLGARSSVVGRGTALMAVVRVQIVVIGSAVEMKVGIGSASFESLATDPYGRGEGGKGE